MAHSSNATPAETLGEIHQAARKLLKNELAPRVAETEASGDFCRPAFRVLASAGLAAPMLPEPWGLGSISAQVAVAEEMGYFSSGFGLSALASVCLFGSNIARQGTDEQRAKYLPGIASGEKIGCWALTEPSTGSDAVSIQTRCERKGDHYIVSGSKTFITNAPIADYFIVLAREVGPDGKLVSGFQSGTAFILERGMEGLRTGKPFHKMGHRSSPTGEVFLDQVKVPMNQVLAKPGMAFLGMKTSLDVERAVFGGLGVGLMQFCLDTMVRYGAQRKQFGVSILEHQMVQSKIAEVSSWIEMLHAYRDLVCRKLEAGQSVNKEAAVLKYLGAEWAMKSADHAIQTLGGYGYMEEYGVERCLRDAKLYEIGGGTTEIQKMIIAKQAIKEVLDATHSPS